MTKRARPHFRVAEGASGTPFIVLEQFDGEELQLFRKTVTFDLPEGTTIADAQSIRKFLSNNLVRIAET